MMMFLLLLALTPVSGFVCLLSFQENSSMEHIFLATSFGHKLVGTARLCWTTLQLAWKAIPVLLVSVLLLFGIQAALLPLQLALSQAVIDRLTALAGYSVAPGPTVHDVPLAVW